MSLSTFIKRGVSSFQTLQLVKKFYKNVTLESFNNAPFQNHKYIVKLDGRQVKTPNKNTLATPTESLGLAVAAEFLVQREFLKPPTMPLFSLARTAVDVDADPNLRGHLESAILEYFLTDTIWFREENIPRLYKFQTDNLDPMIDYINKELNVNIQSQKGLEPPKITQNDQDKLINYLKDFDNWKILSLEYSASTLKSTSLAIALMNNRVGIEEALDLSRLEENFQQTLYGIVEGDHDLNEKTQFMMVAAAKNFYNLSE